MAEYKSWETPVGSWFFDGNWLGESNNTVPTAADTVLINNAGTATIAGQAAEATNVIVGNALDYPQLAGESLGKQGALFITSGGTLAAQQLSAAEGDATGALISVSGSGSSVVIDDPILSGIYLGSGGGTAHLVLDAGATIDATGPNGQTMLGFSGAGVGIAQVDGAATRWNNATLYVGNEGTGALTVTHGARVVNRLAGAVARRSGSHGTVTLESAAAWSSEGSWYAVGAAGTGAVFVRSGSTLSSGATVVGFDATGSGTVMVDGAGSTWAVGGAFTVGDQGSGVVIVTNSGALSSTNDIVLASRAGSSGTIVIGDGALAGVLDVPSITGGSGTAELVFSQTDATYHFTRDGSATGSAITVGGSVAVTHDSPGTTALTGNNSYTGGTTVSGGTLLVTGSVASTTAVAGGATLGGSGRFGGTVTIADGGTLAPGNAVGTLTVDSDLVLNDASVLAFELSDPAGTAGVDSDLIVVNGDLTLDGVLDLTNLGSFGAGSYRLFDYTGALTDRTLSVSNLPTGYSASIDTATPNQVNLVVTLTTYPVTTAVNPIAAGSLTCTPDPVPHGSATTCTASANPGYTFTGFSGDCTGVTCTLSNVTAAQSVTANFSLNYYAITATASPIEGGMVACSPDPVAHGSDATCTASANTGYTFTGFSGACSGTTCTLSNVTAPQSVTGHFALNQYPVTAEVGPAEGGSVTCTPNPVDHGSATTCTLTPAAGFRAIDTVGGSCPAGSWQDATTYRVDAITAACSVSFAFLLDGACGDADATPALTTPGADLCAFGTPGPVTSAQGAHAWSCAGDFGGSDAQCSAPGASPAGFPDNTVTLATADSDGCTFDSAQLIEPPAGLPAGVALPYGAVNFTLSGCAGDPARATVTLTHSGPVETLRFWKHVDGRWVDHMPATLSGHQLQFTLTDGSDWDSDPRPGVIADPGGVGTALAVVPALGTWALGLLAGLLATLGVVGRRRG